jgi:hypothetical protein
MSEWVSNSKLYRELSQPFESAKAADEALNAFFEDVRAAREKHKVPECYIITSATWTDGDKESGGFSAGGFGKQMEHEAMCAYALGKVQSEREEKIAAILGNLKKGKR